MNSTKLWWKYNSNIQDLLLKQLQDNWAWSQYDLMLFKDSRVVPILSEIVQATASIIEKFNRHNIYEYDRILKTQAIETLGYLGDTKAVEPIINVLQDRNQDE